MKNILAALVVRLGCAGQAGNATAQDAAALPDLKGRWVGISETVVLGNARHHGPSPQNTPRLSSVEFTLAIEGQDGRRFWGTVASKGEQEPLLGVIGFDGKTFVARDSDGSLQGNIVDRDTMEFIYSHTGNSTVVSATRAKRQR